MKERLHDIATVPNLITAARLAFSPIIAKRLHDDPGGTWGEAAAFLASDNVDGVTARLGDHSETLTRLGFRTSETGRKLDPVTDTIVTGEMVIAGMHSGVIPKWLGGMALAQKAIKSFHAIAAERQGAEVHVTNLGKYSEEFTNLNLGLLFPGENIKNDEQRRNYRQKHLVGAVIGIAGAFMADRGYVAQAKRQRA